MIIIFFIVISIANCYNVSGALNPSRLSLLHFLETRNPPEVCSWQCGKVSDEVSIQTDWELDITASNNNSIIVSIGYNATLKLIGFINHKLHIAVALDGNTGFVGWFNLTSGATIVINIKTGLAKVVHSKYISDLSQDKINTDVALVAFSKVITSLIQQLGTHSVTEDIFDLLAITDAIYNNYSYASIAQAYFKGRSALEEQIYASFTIWFDLTRDLIASQSVNIDFGIVGFFSPVFGRPHNLFGAILKLWVLLYKNTPGQFNGLLTLAIYRLLSVNIPIDESDQVFGSLTFTIAAIGSFYGALDSALSAYEGRYRLANLEERRVKIENVTYVIACGKFVEDSWFVNLKASWVDVVLLYVKSANVFAIYNRKLDVILVFSGSSGLFGVWNTKTGEGIIVRYATGAAIVISSNSAIVQSFSADAIIHGSTIIAAKIDSYKTFGYSLLDKSTFLFGAYLLIGERSGIAAANVAVSSSVRAVIVASFNKFFGEVSKTKLSFGVLNVVHVASGGINTGWSAQIQEFIVGVYSSKLAGRFDSRLFAAVYYEFSVNFDVVGSREFLGKITSAIKNITSVGEDISTAISSALKAHGVISGSLIGSVFI